MMSTVHLKDSTSNLPSGVRNFIKFSDDKLHAESSRNMYSLQGLEALIGAVALEVCHLLMVVSNCIPGSPHCHAASAMTFITSRARYTLATSPVLMCRVVQSLSST